MRQLLLFLLLLCSPMLPAQAETVAERFPVVKEFFPQADRFGAFEGTPPSAPIYQEKKLIGYALLSDDVVRIPAYSGKPVNMLIGLDLKGTIVGAKVIEHQEPILLVGIPESELHDFALQYVGKHVSDRIKVGAAGREGYINVDAVTGATVTVMVVNETILRAARKVAVARGIISETAEAKLPPAKVRMKVFQEADWKYLTGNGAIRRLLITRGELEEAFKGTEGEGVRQVEDAGECVDLPPGEDCDTFIDMYYAYLNAPTIGRNLLGESQYNWLMAELKAGEHAIAVMANGIYSFKGSGYVRGGIFDRIQFLQDNREITIRDLDYHRLNDVYAKGMPDFTEMAIFIIRAAVEFDPGRQWAAELLVRRQTGPLTSVFTSFSGGYEIPEEYVELPPAPAKADAGPVPMWVSIWEDRAFQIAILVAGLIVLTAILLFQDWLVQRPKLLKRLRTGYLLYTLFFIGWYSLAQLSVVNVLTFVSALFTEFHWQTFLMDPLIFILWAFVAVTLLLWGRGIYCGWLCPYGALQELVNKVARNFNVRQLEFPDVVHERLWALKYIILIALFGISLQSVAEAERYAEVEPFKTAILFHFQREWPFVLYAAGLVVVSVFNRKFYCKYLCPLGAALVIPGKHRLFSWLRRRNECGKPCQVCSNECEVRAIAPTGEINANECHYCMDCQITYFNDHKCPPLVQERKRRDKRAAMRRASEGAEELEDIPVRVEATPG